MSTAKLYRLSGLSLLIGVAIGIISQLNNFLLQGDNPRQMTSALWTIAQLVTFIGPIFLLLGLPAIAFRQSAYAGWLGYIGFVLMFIGGFLITSFTIVPLIVFPWLAQSAPYLITQHAPTAPVLVYFLVASIVFAAGGIILGLGTVRAGIFPRYSGLLILIGAVLNLVNFPLTGILGAIVGTLAFIILAAGLAWIGYILWTTKSAEIVPPVPTAE